MKNQLTKTRGILCKFKMNKTRNESVKAVYDNMRYEECCDNNNTYPFINKLIILDNKIIKQNKMTFLNTMYKFVTNITNIETF